MEQNALIETFEKFFSNFRQKPDCWAIFKNGTCVWIYYKDDASSEEKESFDISKYAKDLLKEYGPIHPGSPQGYFYVNEAENIDGYFVSFHISGLISYVSENDEEVKRIVDRKKIVEQKEKNLVIGLIGRYYRKLDSESLEIVHIENGTKEGKNDR